MDHLLWLIPALPFAGFVLLVVFGKHLPRAGAALIGVGSVGLAALLTLVIGATFLSAPPPNHVYAQTLWTWLNIDGFAPAIGLTLDPLALTMTFVITFVGFLIHLYSVEYMRDDAGFSRFFACMNLFVGSMLVLVLADNLLLLYLGWEGVGLCSYLLIGFWYTDPANVRAANKAFIVTRVGDTAMAIGLFLLFQQFGTLDIQTLMTRAAQQWPVGSPLAIAAAALLLGGAVGKSAQLPLQTWLPDAMAGPTPVSALIHAATMVTAGVYLIARTHALFALAPPVMAAVALIGAATLLLAGVSALVQTDIKRVLAYSTISQIGYMFLALGVGAWPAAIFHFLTHAFFKALLFLGAGSVILALHHEQNMLKMGGLRRKLPLTFWTFLIGAASLAGLPLLTAGFYSKDWIIWDTYASPTGNGWLWLAGVGGALLTALYSFRMVFLTFYGDAKTSVVHRPGPCISIALVVLAFFALVAGWLELPASMGHWTPFSDFIHPALTEPRIVRGGISGELVSQLVTGAIVLAGIFISYLLWLAYPALARKIRQSAAGAALGRFWLGGWGFDALYDRLIVRPIIWTARLNKDDAFDLIYDFIAWLSGRLNGVLSVTQTGQVRWYAVAIALGAILMLAAAVLL